MGDYDVMQLDPSAVRQAWEANASHDPVGLTPFSNALSKASELATMFGPTVDIALRNSPKAGGIFNGVISGLLNQGYSAPMGSMGSMSSPYTLPGANPSMGGMSGFQGKFLGSSGTPSMPGTAPGYPGAGGGFSGMPGAAPGYGGGMGGMPAGGGMSSSFGQVEGQVADMATTNTYLLAFQAKINNISTMIQLFSNVEKARAETTLAPVRNIGRS